MEVLLIGFRKNLKSQINLFLKISMTLEVG